MAYDKMRDLAYCLCGERLAVAFVGSGLSRNYCDWTGLIKILCEYIGEDTSDIEQLLEMPLIDADQLLVIADFLRSKIKNTEFKDLMKRNFTGKTDNIPHVFNVIVQSPFAFFLTTNYDTNIEEAYRRSHGRPLKVILSDRCEEVLECFKKNEQFVWKIHGCAELGGEYVLGSRDYRRLIYGNKKVLYVLRAIFATRPIVFMGYGSRDPHINRYIEYEDQVLQRGGMRRFIFCKKDTHTLISKHRVDILKITEVLVDNWDQIPDILLQLTFVRIRDEYKRCRSEYSKQFQEFVKESKVESIWGAMYYVYASSDQGYSDVVQDFLQTILSNKLYRDALERIPALSLLYRIISGQYHKTHRNYDKAKKFFDESVNIATHETGILPPIRSLSYRYAGLFYMNPDYPSTGSCAYIDHNLAKKLYEQSAKVLDGKYPHELLDVQKNHARLLGERRYFKRAADLAMKTAEEARSIGYLKNEAWCRVNAVEMYEKSRPRKNVHFLCEQLEEALRYFKELDHLRGQMQVHRLYADILGRRSRDKCPDTIEYHHKRAKAIAVLVEDDNVRSIMA